MALELGLTVLVMAAVVGAVWLAVKVLRWVRRNRGAATDFAVGAYLSEQLGNWIDGWTDGPTGYGVPHGDGCDQGHHTDHGGGHHHDHGGHDGFCGQ